MKIFASILLLAMPVAYADPVAGLSPICDKASSEGKPFADCNAGLAATAPSNDQYNFPGPDSLVRKCAVAGCDWNDPAQVYVRFKTLAAGDYTDSCQTALEPGTREPNPWSWAVTKCATWKAVPKSQLAVAPPAPSVVSGPTPLTWTAPLTFTDGNPATGLTYNVYRDGAKIAFGLAGLAYLDSAASPGAHSYFVTASSGGSEGAPSATITASVSAPIVPAPTGLKASAATVYDLVKSRNKFTLKPVGTIPLGTPCLPASAVEALGYGGVDQAIVAMTPGLTRPQVALAKCN
jgi:hypothetical protein